MGLADRDYARAQSLARSPRRPGALALISVNTWLIIINVAVFIIGNVVLGNVVVKAPAGTWLQDGLTREQARAAYVATDVQFQSPELPGTLYHPIFERKPAGVIAATGQVVDASGTPVREVGRYRFRYDKPLHAVGSFSTGRLLLDWEIWRILTFQFLHANLWHLIFNMLGLWFVGGIVEAALGSKRYAAFYLVCGIFGALAYLFLNLLGWYLHLQVPGVLFSDPYTPLVGASAGVFGVLLAAAYVRPNDVVLVSFILPMRLRTAVYLFVAFAALNLWMGGNNAGGDAAHIGGALAGAYFVRRPYLLRDFFDIFGKRSAAPRRAPARVRPGDRDEVDAILAKIHDRGLASITPEERAALHRAREELDS